MSNHYPFHFLVNTKEDLDSAAFGNDLKVMLRSYSTAINKQENRTGSLFQQHTKVKCLEEEKQLEYPFICFHYIHQNPFKAKLVDKMESYEMSSFQDYAGLRSGTLVNKELAKQLLQIPIDPPTFVDQSYKVKIDDDESFL
jgi:putative transposase